MADFIAGELETFSNGMTDSRSLSRHSSMSSDRSRERTNKENARSGANRLTNALTTGEGDSDEGSDVSSGQLILRDGGGLGEESGTENPAVFGLSKSGERGDGGREKAPLELPPRQHSGSGTGTARHRVNKAGASSTIPEVEIAIPNDGCLASFSADAMAGFFRHLRLDDRLVTHLHRNGLDGRRFGRLKDTDLDNLRLNNPVIVYFRDRTAPVANKKSKQRIPFVL